MENDTPQTWESDDLTDVISTFCGRRIHTVADLAKVAYASGIQPSDIIAAAIDQYARANPAAGVDLA